MKRLFILVILGFMGHISFVHSTNKFHHLNDLPRYAQVKCECEGLERAIIFKSRKEKACNFLDKESHNFVVEIRDQVYIAKHKKDWIDSAATLAKLTRDVATKLADSDYHNQIEEAVRTIIPEASDKVVAAECAMLVELTANAVKAEFNKK
jgi:hypothetical protein